MPAFTDQLGRTIILPQVPRRIISLVPSQMELLYSLGLEPSVVGITRFCKHPEAWFHSKSRIGGTKAIDPIRVDALQPDLIIANKEENERPQIEALAERYPVWVSDIKNLADALAMIRSIGELTGTSATATTLADEIARRFAALPSPAARLTTLPTPTTAKSRPNVAYLIWRNPWMTIGGDTFIHQMLGHAGFTNIFANHTRYPEIDLSSLAGTKNITIFLSSEPYPFRERHRQEITDILPHANVKLVDGELFSWYGSRLLHSPAYFEQLREEILL